MSGGEDAWGCLAAVALIGGGGYWLYSEYEVKKRGSEPVELEEITLPRPTGTLNVTTTKEGTAYHIDADTVRGPKEARLVWVHQNHEDDKTVPYRYTKQLLLVNCETMAVKTLSMVGYNADDTVRYSYNYEADEAETSYYPPGAVGFAAPNRVCQKDFDPPA